METQLNQAQKMEAIGTLAGGIAHDFNNILSSIMGYTEIALYDEIPEESPAHYSMNQVLKASHRAKDLVKQILAFSRQGSDETKPIKLNSIVTEGLKLLRASLPSNIEIRQNIRTASGLVMADPTQMHQVLMNLCTNAYHAMREKGGELNVELFDVNLNSLDETLNIGLKPGKYVKLTISDTGHGMNQGVLERVFDPYFTTKPKEEGTGLGLSLVHGIVESFGSKTTVESAPGKGATFTIFLPRIESEDKPEIKDPGPVPTGIERILFVDDETLIVEITEKMLQRLGYDVTSKTSSIEALEVFMTKPEAFDLVITDLTMPKMTGDVLAEEILQIRPDIPVILCTGFSERITEDMIKELGIRKYIMKPILRNEIAQTIRDVLGSKR